jgi:hypothetical protein
MIHAGGELPKIRNGLLAPRSAEESWNIIDTHGVHTYSYLLERLVTDGLVESGARTVAW